MNKEVLLNTYLERLKELSLERLKERDISVIEALKESLRYLEGEMRGY